MIPVSSVRRLKHAARWVSGAIRVPEANLMAVVESLFTLITAREGTAEYKDPLKGNTYCYLLPERMHVVACRLARLLGGHQVETPLGASDRA